MYPVTSDFLTEVQRSHRMGASADLYYNGALVQEGLPVIDGEVAVDRNAAVRRSCRLALVDTLGTLIPLVSSAGGLSPYGAELRVHRGVYVNGALESVPLGVFRISDAEVADEGGVAVAVTGYDRSRAIARNKFVDPYVVASGTSYTAALTALASNRMPTVAVVFENTATGNTPLLVLDAGSDPWAELTNMAAAVGLIPYFDVLGQLVFAAAPSITDPSVWTWAEGTSATILAVDRSLSDEPGYNGVVLTAESSTLLFPLRVTVWDTNPGSPTYYLGPYGQVPMFATSPYVSNASQAQAAADMLLAENLGLTESVRVSAVPNPALAEDDPVTVTRVASGVAISGLIDSMSIPLTAEGSMTAAVRTRRGPS